MGVRQAINSHPLVGSIIAVICVAIGGVWMLHSITRPRLDNKFGGYYSDDDGETFFADTFPKSVPFEHSGRQAYRARVFRCGDGEPFVAWLESFPDDVNASFSSQTDPQARFLSFEAVSDRVLVKRPGDVAWIAPPGGNRQPATRPGGADYQSIIAPPCSGASREVLPSSQ